MEIKTVLRAQLVIPLDYDNAKRVAIIVTSKK